MRQRITFPQDPQYSTDPKVLKVDKKGITTLEDIKSARELQITFTLEELPQELYKVFKASQEVNIKWVTSKQFESIPPMVSRLSPGLHVFYTPKQKGDGS